MIRLQFFVCMLVFFFQAEDGIRDAQESRGLGDVYKRQGERWDLSTMSAKYGPMERGWKQLLPSLFVPHGSPPIPIERCASEQWLQSAAGTLPRKPSAIIFMSPHFLRSQFVVSAARRPVTLMDFDDDTDPDKLVELEKLGYPCNGSPGMAQRVASLLGAAGLECGISHDRGLDHGVWTPLYVMYPDADIPVLSLSVHSGLDAAAHMRAGTALSCLAGEGVLIIGSGEVVHNVPLMGLSLIHI
eukprot:TRINITY_DN36212_c0_g1_i1.p1 TRINITY_DN36212_c0_g1~~TRINITY_DN36212_c0_g1_i1.p1  ORF type:complete len:243 (+),score=50.51 TRINITY_DN36212_c0_g1_i1:28-756(+)